MSDPMSNLEIEDVLSSIRRLVAQEGGSPSPAQHSVAGAEAVAADKFVLTPDFRVREDAGATEEEPAHLLADAVPEPLAPAGGSLATLEDTIAELEAAVAARGGEEWEPDGGAPGEPIAVFSRAKAEAGAVIEPAPIEPAVAVADVGPVDEPLVLAEAEDFLAESDWELAADPSATRIVEFPSPRDVEEEAIAEVAGVVEMSEYEYSVEYEEVEEAPFIAVDGDEEDVASATLHDLSSRRLHLVSPVVVPQADAEAALAEDEPGEVLLDAASEDRALEEMGLEDVGPEGMVFEDGVFEDGVEIVGIGEIIPTDPELSVSVETPVILTEEDAFRLDVMPETVVRAETVEIPAAAIPRSEDRAFRIGDDDDDEADLFAEEEPLVLNEEELRDMVAEIIRQELQGALGERITRNVRKMVRAEIRRALASKDFE